MPGQTGQPPSSYGPVLGQFAWIQYPFANDYGGYEPFGGNNPFPKPDINVQVPQGYPITSLTSGTVTSVDTSSSYGYVVTVQMDQPVNSLATHIAYLHLGSVQVSPNQRVSGGDQIGTAGPPTSGGFQNAPTGVAFYPGPQYGSGPEWNQYFQNSSNPQLNPYSFLRTFVQGGGTNLPPGVLANYSGVHASNDPLCNVPVIGGALCALRDANILPRIGEGILGGLLILAGVIAGIMVLMNHDPQQVLGKAFKGAK